MAYTNISTILPPDIKAITGDVTFRPVQSGRSGIGIFRASIYEGGREVYLKVRKVIEEFEPGKSLKAEAEKLTWLHQQIPVPRVEAFCKLGDHEFLLLSSLKGRDASNVRNSKEAERNLPLIVEVIKKLHALPTLSCPFNQEIDTRIEQARKRLEAGLVDRNDFDEERRGIDPKELFSQLLTLKPQTSDLVVTHGDFCLPNIIIDRKEVSGVVDVGRVGIGDRYQDLALLSRSLSSGLNPFYGKRMAKKALELYGITSVDEGKIEFFQILDEFF